MNEDRLATEFFVSLCTRRAALEGIPITIIHRGYASSGTILLKINLLNGYARVLMEARSGDDRIWTPVTSEDTMSEKDADAYLFDQVAIDPDVWLVEIEDKQGRIWFPGKVVNI